MYNIYRHSSSQIIGQVYSQNNISHTLNQVQWPYPVNYKCSNHKVITDCDCFSNVFGCDYNYMTLWH